MLLKPQLFLVQLKLIAQPPCKFMLAVYARNAFDVLGRSSSERHRPC